jgi:PHD/YefM family antitoxin component YafN of YafNO toxin-antitoxin module
MDIYNTSQARTNLFKIVDYVNISHGPVYIVGKKNNAVIIAEEEYKSLTETLHLTSIPGMKESIIKASKDSLKNYTDRIDWDDV